jgi:serine/threonine protein kinase
MNLNDFIWSIPTLEVLKDQNLQSEEEVLRIMTMIVISLHNLHRKNLFHGDIKPANIFFDKDFKIMTTDVGSLIYLGKPDEDELETSKFIVTCYTENYASAEYIDAVKNKIPLTREQLMKEDKH